MMRLPPIVSLAFAALIASVVISAAPPASAQKTERPHLEPQAQVKVLRAKTRMRVLNARMRRLEGASDSAELGEDVLTTDCADIEIAPVQSGRTPGSTPVVVTGDIIQVCGR